MEIVSRYKISSKSDLVFCKVDLQKILKQFKDKEFYIFSVMELGSNILKYAKKGEIWLLESDGEYLLAALDKGEGIKDLNWALKEGTTSSNSLGMGLYSIANHKDYDFLIYSSKMGSIFLIKPKNLKKDYVYLMQSYMDKVKSGDFIFKKEKYIFFGDVSGHGIKAYEVVRFIRNFIKEKRFSCIIADEFLKDLHEKILQYNLRSLVIAIIELLPNEVNICGVGNISILKKVESKIKSFSQAKGIIGEVFFDVSKINLKRDGNIILFSDGIDEKLLYNLSEKINNIYLLAIASIYFSQKLDDKSILVIGENDGTSRSSFGYFAKRKRESFA